MPHVNIAICTCQRPGMLQALLQSIENMQQPDKVRISVSIIDNDPEQSAAPVFKNFSEYFPAPLYYFSEVQRGIPFARNRALQEAVELRADYLAFVDDDEWVEPDWLVTLYAYIIRKGGKCVVSGSVVPELPPQAPSYMKEIFIEKDRPTGMQLSSCATNNVIFPITLTTELGIRFDERYPFEGGEDTKFFCAAVDKGVEIFKCAEARVHETILPVRMTSRWLAKRKFRSGIAVGKRKISGGRSPLSLIISSSFQSLIYGLLAVLSLVLLRRYSYFKALMKASRNAGIVSGLIGVRMDGYRRIDS